MTAKTLPKSGNRLRMADKADIHRLYELSVQSVEDEVEFLDETFRELRDRAPISLREDFCGTAKAACEWVGGDHQRTAIGVDIDADVLRWGRDHHVADLANPARARVQLLNEDVLTVRTEPADIAVAFNFSYWIFKDRVTLANYFRNVRTGLVDDGVLFLDAYGGSEAYEETKEKTKHDGFTYVWQQAAFDPITSFMKCHIHFKFPDGSKLKKAFSYDWRLWTLPEIRELLAEAGFSRSTVYWQAEDDDGGDDGPFEPVEHGEADPAWITYIVAER